MMFFSIIVNALDFQQGMLYGVIKAIDRQKCAAYLNFISCNVLALPLSFCCAFYFGTRTDDNNKEVEGLGPEGLWIGFIIGYTHQCIAYQTLIALTNWKDVCDNAEERISRNSSLNTSFEKTDREISEDKVVKENLLLHLNLCNALENID